MVLLVPTTLPRRAALTVWTPCKRCGRHDTVDTRCTYCAGFGIVNHDEPHDCPQCGGSGSEWPPRCACGAYRKSLNLQLEDPDSTEFEYFAFTDKPIYLP